MFRLFTEVVRKSGREVTREVWFATVETVKPVKVLER